MKSLIEQNIILQTTADTMLLNCWRTIKLLASGDMGMYFNLFRQHIIYSDVSFKVCVYISTF